MNLYSKLNISIFENISLVTKKHTHIHGFTKYIILIYFYGLLFYFIKLLLFLNLHRQIDLQTKMYNH